jgi:hypothetical protein
VTEIADDGDFLRVLNHELALATRYAATGLISGTTASHGDDDIQEEEHQEGVEMCTRPMTMSDSGHALGSTGSGGDADRSVTVKRMSFSTSASLGVRHHFPQLPPGHDPCMETERLNIARKAMMCIREIIRTERSYVAHLCRAAESEVS